MREKKSPAGAGSYRVYGKPVIPVPLEMRVDSKHRDVGFLALSGRCTVTSLTTANSHKRTYSGAPKDQNRLYGKPPLKRQNQLWFPADQWIEVMLNWNQFCFAPLAPPRRPVTCCSLTASNARQS